MRMKSHVVSLRTRLMLLVAVSLLPAIVLLTLQGFRDYAAEKKNLHEEAENLAYRISMHSKEAGPEPKRYLENLAKIAEIKNEGAGCNAFLALTLKTDYYYDNIFVADRSGNVVCSGIELPVSLNLANRSYFGRVMARKAFAVGDVQHNDNSGEPVVVFALPVLDVRGEVTRVLGLVVNFSWFNDSFKRGSASSRHLDKVAATVSDSDGVIIASAPGQKYVGKRLLEWNRIRARVNENSRYTASEMWRDGVMRTTTYLPVFSSDVTGMYFLRVGIPQGDSLAVVEYRTAWNFLLLALAALLAMTAAWWLSSWLVLKPIGVLTRTAALLGAGDMNARTGLAKSGGEVGELARSFDEMANQLQIQHDSLQRLNRVQAMRSATNGAILRAENEQTLLNDICQVVRQTGGYQLAWFGYSDKFGSRMFRVQAHDGATSEMLTAFEHLRKDSPETEMGPVANAVRFGKPQVMHNLQTPLNDAPWRLAAASSGFAAAIGLPIKVGEDVIGALGIFSIDPDAFGTEEIQLLTATANDVAFGIAAARAMLEVRRSREFLGLVINNIPSMVFVKEAADLRFVSINPAGEKFLGLENVDYIGKTDAEIFAPEQARGMVQRDLDALNCTQPVLVTESQITTVDGKIKLVQTKRLRLTDANGDVKYLLGISEDITEQRKAEERLIYLATHDGLTGLPNRHLLMTSLNASLERAAGAGQGLSVLYIDLDGFKEINDTLGHFTGDELLRDVAALLRQVVHNDDTVARVGGDEFVLVLEQALDPEALTVITDEIKKRFMTPFSIAGQEIVISSSIGISRFPEDARDGETLLRNADIAMYAAKALGRNTHSYYSADMHTRVIDRLEMRNLLRSAIEKNELVVHYQPKVSMLTGSIVGAEALVRWHSKELGFVSPARFIPLAEESGLIVPIGEWVLRTACEQARQWQSYGPLMMAVNLSPRQLHQKGLLQIIATILNDAGLGADLLELEVTEGSFMDKDSGAIGLLTQISEMGIRLAVDDFGTGYSSLAYLKQLPVNVLKIDQSFVKGLMSDESDVAIVTAIVAMARSLKLSVIAEGVETFEQLAILRALECDENQGYLFSRPLPAKEFGHFLSRPDLLPKMGGPEV